MISGLRRNSSPKVLLDLREGGGMRGLHLAASVSLLVARGVPAELWALHGDADDVVLELALLREASGQFILRWRPGTAGLRFDLLVAMADDWPAGATWNAARGVARRTLLGLMFPDPGRTPERHVAIACGHDTGAFADRIGMAIAASRHGFNPWRGPRA